MTNPLKEWIVQSREMQRRFPGQYLASYAGELGFDERHVWMTQEIYETILRNCGRYDATVPTGQYCGKMFIRGQKLVWFGIDKENPMTRVKWNTREILIKPSAGAGPTRRPPP